MLLLKHNSRRKMPAGVLLIKTPDRRLCIHYYAAQLANLCRARGNVLHSSRLAPFQGQQTTCLLFSLFLAVLCISMLEPFHHCEWWPQGGSVRYRQRYSLMCLPFDHCVHKWRLFFPQISNVKCPPDMKETIHAISFLTRKFNAGRSPSGAHHMPTYGWLSEHYSC